MAELITPLTLIKHIELTNMLDFKPKRIASDSSNTAYQIGGLGTVITGKPDINWQDFVIIKEEGIIYTCGEVFTCMKLHGNNLRNLILSGNYITSVPEPLTRWYMGDTLIKEEDVTGELTQLMNPSETFDKVEIETSVTSIGDIAFLDCSSLTSITIPNSVISIGNSAFYMCNSL